MAYTDADIAKIAERCKSNTHRIDEQEKRIDNIEELTTTVKVLATREARVEADVSEIKSDVKTLAAKPGKRWDGLVDKAIYALAGAVLAWLAAGGGA